MLDWHRRINERRMNERLSRVIRVIEAARTIAHENRLISDLVTSTGLSAEGVRLAMDQHLELSPTDADLAQLLAVTIESDHVHVILSANVFVGALRALAIACASSPNVTVRPSSREPHFATALVQAIDRPAVRLSSDAPPSGEIHVYGRDETIAAVQEAAATGVVVRGHGAGMGFAFVDETADLSLAARSVAEDVVPFDQRGCLSPRVVAVQSTARAQAFATALDEQLARAQERVPRGKLSTSEVEELERYASTVAYAGELKRTATHTIGIAPALLIPPSGRNIHVMPVAGIEELRVSIAPISRWIVAIGTDDVEIARSWAPAHARVSTLGRMQKPPLDGPVDRR
jgi:Acyl-CoA reductase (LuxC)